MARTDVLFFLLLGHLFLVGVCSSCVAPECAQCNISAECCQNHLNDSNQCTNVVEVFINSSGSKAKEGETIRLTCVHTFPDLTLTFAWFKDGEKKEGEDKRTLLLENVLPHKVGKFVCSVNSTCGSCKSLPEDVTVENGAIIIMVVCGVSALVLVVIMGLAMKFKLNRDNIKHKERMRQRMQAQQNDGPSPFTPRGV